MKPVRRILLHLVALAATSAPAAAQAPSLAVKNVTMIIGSGTGGGNDLWGRLVARHIGKHLPGKPIVVPQNMPGAAGLSAVNYIYNIAPKDGTVLGTVVGPVALGPLSGAAGARFDALKITWVGMPTMETSVCIAMARAQVKTYHDLLANELVTGNTGVGAGPYIYPKALNGILGTKFKPISGFPSTSNVLLAMERGEIDGICSSFDSISNQRPDWIPNKKVVVLFQAGVAPTPKLKDVPFVKDLARTMEEKQAVEFLYAGNDLARPFLAPPNMPAERVKMLRDAFNATMKDPQFLADAERQKLDVQPNDGEYLAALIKQIYATPKPIVDKVTELIK
jgi:tripartite-type tricarboxylate transporter receptor subunit TctC